jgi:hypothetical protein
MIGDNQRLTSAVFWFGIVSDRNDAVERRAAARRHAGFPNEGGAATSAGPTFTAESLLVHIRLCEHRPSKVEGKSPNVVIFSTC